MNNMGTSSKELDTMLHANLFDIYKGALPCDTLPLVDDSKQCFIVNTDTSMEPGTHWLAFYILPNRFTFFIDPQALPHHVLNPYLRQYISKNRLHPVLTMPYCIQDISSKLCGPFCCFILLYMSKYRNNLSNLIEENFSDSDLIANDNFIKTWWDCKRKKGIKGETWATVGDNFRRASNGARFSSNSKSYRKLPVMSFKM